MRIDHRADVHRPRWVVHVRRREVAVRTRPTDEGYAEVQWVAFDVHLDLVGLAVTMDELLV